MDLTSTHTWVRHEVTGGTWQCPTEALGHYQDLGWQPCEPPAEPNPAVAELLAARVAQEQSEPAAPRGKSK